MKTLDFYKAQDTGKSNRVEGVVLTFVVPFPDCNTLAEAETFYERQAADIHEALSAVLCGGVYDRLCALMLQKKASMLIIRHGD